MATEIYFYAIPFDDKTVLYMKTSDKYILRNAIIEILSDKPNRDALAGKLEFIMQNFVEFSRIHVLMDAHSTSRAVSLGAVIDDRGSISVDEIKRIGYRVFSKIGLDNV
jgi:hypothetical protein